MSSKTLRAIADFRTIEHEVGICKSSAEQYGYAITSFARFLGHEPTLDDLTSEKVNSWLESLREKNKPATIKGKRTHLLVLWRFAFNEGFIEHLPRKIRKVRLPIADPIAWTHEEISKLVETALGLDPWPRYSKAFYRHLKEAIDSKDPLEFMTAKGCRITDGGRATTIKQLKNEFSRLKAGNTFAGRDYDGIRHSIWFASLVAAAWDSGLRLGDLLRIDPSTIRRFEDGGRLRITQSKTQYPIECWLNDSTLELIDRCMAEGDPRRKVLWPAPKSKQRLWHDFRILVAEAEVRPGQFRWIRRGAGSAAEALRFGAGTALLGHRTRDVTVRHYLDPSIAQQELIRLPSIKKA